MSTFMLLTVIFLAEKKDYNVYNYGEFISNKIVYLYGDKVNIRNTPSVKSKVVDNLSAGYPLLILEKSSETYTIDGYKAPWYKVSFAKGGKKKEGYVWGGLLSLLTIPFTTDDNKEELFLVRITKFDKSTEKFTGQVKILKGDKEICSSDFIPSYTPWDESNTYDYSITGEIMDGRGFTGVKNIFKVSCIYEACGYENGDFLFFYTGSDLILAAKGSSVSEAGIFDTYTEFIFPDDEGGKKNTLIAIETSEMWTDEDGNELSEPKKETEKKEFYWDGKEIIEK